MIHEDFSSPIDLISNSIGMEFFCNGIKPDYCRNKRAISPKCMSYTRGSGGMLPTKIELSIDIIYLQTFLRKKIYCFKFATIKKGMFRCENQIIVPQASFKTNHQTCKSFHSRESKTFLDSAADSRFQVLDSSFCPWNPDSWFQSLVGFRIPKPRIPDFTSKIFLDSRFHKQTFPRFRNPEPLTVRNVNVSKTPR